ncbi:hypothetical protein, partial [Caballeronia sp. ASUFL_F2_KS49]|uniref:hypothetical protein n=1 Tax=Caballeronia sp. ASUFL_F2_KS49 TaxID=2921773 RepID=UPI0020290257
MDTTTLFADSTNNRVGIGTVTPEQRLDVVTTGTEAARIGMHSDSEGATVFLARSRNTEATPFRLQSGDTIG